LKGNGFRRTIGSILKQTGDVEENFMIVRIVPMQPVKNLEASVDFYEKLGFEVVERNDGWGWAKLRCGGREIMLDRSIGGAKHTPGHGVVYLYPEDVGDFHRRARERGLEVPPLETTFYGMLEFRIDDPDGNRLWIGQEIRP
jgi:catechol 2,3-dioxygenase-like lactoylglutathione lyase family enzyme